MTGAIAIMAGTVSAAAAGGSGAVASNLTWGDIYGEDSGSTQALAVTGILSPIQVTASRTGLGVLNYILNGTFAPYTGAFIVNPNDRLAWAVSLNGSADRSGVITVTNTSAGAVIDQFGYTIYASQGVRA